MWSVPSPEAEVRRQRYLPDEHGNRKRTASPFEEIGENEPSPSPRQTVHSKRGEAE
jgi:hypothetical protein